MKSLLKALLSAAILLPACLGAAPVPAPITAATYPVAPTMRDGSHDFDFEFGTWRTHYRLMNHPLTSDHTWKDCYGTSIIRQYWVGSGNLEDGDLKCANRYIGGMTLRMYNAGTHQWTLWWGTRELGISPPQQVGHFGANGAGDFYSNDSWKGRPIITRFEWTTVNGNPHFAQAFSTDHGRTWETNWTTEYERVSPSTDGVWNVVDHTNDGHDGFAFLTGTWKVHFRQRKVAFANSHEWISCDGTSTVRTFWGGGADLEDRALTCGGQAARGLAVRLYDATKRRWMLYSGSQTDGLSEGLPQMGRFDARGAGEFSAPTIHDGKPVTACIRWENKGGNPHFEIALSADGGKTWETQAVGDYVREG